MALDIETATLEDYRDMMLRPTKLNEIAQVLYDLAQQAGGSLIEIGSNKNEVKELQDRVSALATNLDNLYNTVDTLTGAISALGTAIDNLNERVSILENA